MEIVQALREARAGRMTQAAKREERELYIFIMPWLVGFILFQAGPLIASIFFSLTEWSMLKSPTWVGLTNYATILGKDALFRKTLFNTVYYVIFSVPLGIVLAMLIAILLNQKVRGVTFFRTVYYIPSLVSGVSLAVLWTWIFHPQFGLINHFLNMIGIQGPEWLFNTKTAMPAMIFMSLWGVGGSMVIYLAGLQGIPQHYYEAAEIDGAGWWNKFFSITIPMMTPTIFFNMVMGIIGSFQTFTQFFIMTNGGPADVTLVYVLYLYRNAFEFFRMGYASALAWILFMIILVITMIQFWGARSWVYYEGQVKGR